MSDRLMEKKQQRSDVYLSDEDPIRAPLKILELSQHYCVLKGLRGTLIWSPIMPRDASLLM